MSKDKVREAAREFSGIDSFCTHNPEDRELWIEAVGKEKGFEAAWQASRDAMRCVSCRHFAHDVGVAYYCNKRNWLCDGPNDGCLAHEPKE